MKITKYPWHCNDITFNGEDLVQNFEGKEIAQVYNSNDTKLICRAPEMYDLLQECISVLVDIRDYGNGILTPDEQRIFDDIKELQKEIEYN